MQELEWWAKNLELSNGRAILRQNDTKVTIQADASKKGWGAYCQNETIGGQWTQQESSLHINVLEMTAIKLALLTFSKTLELKGVHFQTDNMSALSYLVKMGELETGKWLH